jgi:hypothetical protein
MILPVPMGMVETPGAWASREAVPMRFLFEKKSRKGSKYNMFNVSKIITS